MKKLARECFFLHKSDRRGRIIALLVMLGSLFFRLQRTTESVPVPLTGSDSLERTIMVLLDSIERNENQSAWDAAKNGSDVSGDPVPPAPVPFDPNTVSPEELAAMHLPDRHARNLVRHREAASVSSNAVVKGKSVSPR